MSSASRFLLPTYFIFSPKNRYPQLQLNTHYGTKNTHYEAKTVIGRIDNWIKNANDEAKSLLQGMD
jgi:hypothetical protein